MGLAALPWYVAHDSIVRGAVQPVLEDHTLPSQEIHVCVSFTQTRTVQSKPLHRICATSTFPAMVAGHRHPTDCGVVCATLALVAAQ